MRLLLLIMTVWLTGCANQAFYAASSPLERNPEIELAASPSANQIATLSLNTEQPLKGIVLHFHGNSGHLEETKEKVAWLTQHGYDVLVFDYSGFGLSQGASTDENIAQDAEFMLKQLQRQGRAFNVPIFAVGTSTGGNILLRALHDTGIELDGVVIDSSFTHYTEVAHHVLDQMPLGFSYAWVANLLMRDDFAIGEKVTDVPSTTSLVLHCEQDQVVPYYMGKRIYQQLQGEKTFVSLAQCAHARGMTDDFPTNQAIVVDWLETISKETSLASRAF